MKVLFSNPPWWVREEDLPQGRYWIAGVRAGSRWPSTGFVYSSPGRYHFSDYLPYPYFLGYAASYLRAKAEVEVRFRDSIALREADQDYYRYLEFEHFDYVFIETSSPSWEHDQAIIHEIHRRCPQTRIVLTGPLVAARAEDLMENHPVYACIKGEYEKGSVRVVNGESGILDFDLLTETEMNAAPFPYYDGLHAKRYWDGYPCGQIPPHAQIWTSRGCPFRCIFCVWPATMTSNDPDGTGDRLVRYYSPEYLEAFITELVERFNYRSIYFDDDTFNLGNRHVLAVCGVMRKIGLPWSAMCRVDTISLDTWKVMRESGCFGVKIGIESGNQWVLDNVVRKNLDLQQAREVIGELKRLGFAVHGTFTLGLPGETPEQMAETQRLSETLPFDSVQVSGTATIEGTPLDTLQREGTLARYPGASIAEDFVCEGDGNVRRQRLFKHDGGQS